MEKPCILAVNLQPHAAWCAATKKDSFIMVSNTMILATISLDIGQW